MKLFKIVFLLFAVFVISCQQDAVINSNEEELTGISAEVKSKIINLGFNAKDSYKVEGGYIVEGDIFLTEAELVSLPNHKIPALEQYRTTNLVTGLPRVITVSIKLGGGGLPDSYEAALNEALARYNSEGLQITFQKVASGGNIQLVKGNGSYLASAGFPSGGNPYGQVKVNSRAIGNQPTNTVASIIAHEIGHCIGFRHTDYYNRAISCGGAATNEGDGGVGAIHIPGTPTTATNAANSFMLSCIGSGQNRPFNGDDVTALNFLY